MGTDIHAVDVMVADREPGPAIDWDRAVRAWNARVVATKEAEIRIAGAQAMATLGGKIEAQVVGTPQDVAKMTDAYMKGMGLARSIDGFFASANDATLAGIDGLTENLAALVGAASRRVGDTRNGDMRADGRVDDTRNGDATNKRGDDTRADKHNVDAPERVDDDADVAGVQEEVPEGA